MISPLSSLAACVLLVSLVLAGSATVISSSDLPLLSDSPLQRQQQQQQQQQQLLQQTQQQHSATPQAQNMFNLFNDDSVDSNSNNASLIANTEMPSGSESPAKYTGDANVITDAEEFGKDVDQDNLGVGALNNDIGAFSEIDSPQYLDPKRAYSPKFFGRKRAGPMFFGKKRGSPMFFGKKRAGPRFFGKKRGSPMFFGKKRASPMFFGKKRASPMFFGKKRASPMFFGKRQMGGENFVDRVEMGKPAHLLNKRSAEMVAPSPQQTSSQNVAKREYAPRFMGKRFSLYRQPDQFSLSSPYMSTKEFKETFRRSDPYFMGKRANELDQDAHYDLKLFALKRQAPRFFGKRGAPRFFGKRQYSPRFFGKRQIPHFFGKRASPRFFGKRELGGDKFDSKFDVRDSEEQEDVSVEDVLQTLARLVEVERLLNEKRNREGNMGRRETEGDDYT